MTNVEGAQDAIQPPEALLPPPPPRPEGAAHEVQAPAPSPLLACQACGRAPAVPVKLVQGIGMLVIHRSKISRGNLCKECGLRLYRATQRKTLLTGWWGLFSLLFYNPMHIVTNLRARKKLAALPDPIPV